MSEHLSELVVIEASRFFSHRRVHDLLTSWGERLRQWDGVVPEAWGWPGSSMDFREVGRSTNPAELSAPEACIDRLRYLGCNLETIHRMVKALPLIPHVSLELRYISELEEPDIAVQIGASARVVEQALSSGRNAVRRSLIALRGRIGLRREVASSI